MKVRAAKKLIDEGLSTRRVRAHIEFLDREIHGWAYRDLREFGGVAVIRDSGPAYFTATPARQFLIPGLAFQVLEAMSKEGSLGELREFEPFVTMNPRLLSGNPVIRGTRLETSFVAELISRGVSRGVVQETYSLREIAVSKALEFERLAA